MSVSFSSDTDAGTARPWERGPCSGKSSEWVRHTPTAAQQLCRGTHSQLELEVFCADGGSGHVTDGLGDGSGSLCSHVLSRYSAQYPSKGCSRVLLWFVRAGRVRVTAPLHARALPSQSQSQCVFMFIVTVLIRLFLTNKTVITEKQALSF